MDEQHVGTWLRKRWEESGYSAEGLAQLSGVSRRTLTRIVAGGRVTVYVAGRLAAPLKLPAEVVRVLPTGNITPAELDRIIAAAKLVLLWTALDIAAVLFLAAM